jgi:ferric-dicitrate binding protein FerR (iron transport regulator)
VAWRSKKDLWNWFLRFVPAIFTIPSLLASEVDSSALQKDAALVLSASGQVSTEQKGQDWAIGRAERIWVTKPIVTGEDGYASFQVAGGTTFEVFAHTRLVFRKNPGNPQDLLDMETGRVSVQVHASAEETPTRIVTPVAVITSRGPSAFAIAVDDEDGSARVDVQQGEVAVQHALLPRSNPVIVRAGDAIAVQADEPLISRTLDRGSLYRYAFHTVWKTLGSAIPGHLFKPGNDFESGGQIIARARAPFCD